MGRNGVPDSTEVVVHGRHVDLSSRFREHVTEKLERVNKYGVPVARVDVEVSKETNPAWPIGPTRLNSRVDPRDP